MNPLPLYALSALSDESIFFIYALNALSESILFIYAMSALSDESIFFICPVCPSWRSTYLTAVAHGQFIQILDYKNSMQIKR